MKVRGCEWHISSSVKLPHQRLNHASKSKLGSANSSPVGILLNSGILLCYNLVKTLRQANVIYIIKFELTGEIGQNKQG
jgi:hypothetical protein